MCDICVSEKRGALKINRVIICHKCINFFEHHSKINNRTTNEEINHQMDKKTKFRRVVRANRMLKNLGYDNIFLALKGK